MTGFDSIYQAYFSDVYLYLKKLSGNESIAEEMTSETFFKAMHAIDHFRGDCDIRVWLCQIAKNTYYSYLKKHRCITTFDESDIADLPEYAINVDDDMINRSEAMRGCLILHTLSEPYKEVFMLRAFSELSFEQIGKIFGKTQNWACVTYHRARNKIKEKMEDKDHEKCV